VKCDIAVVGGGVLGVSTAYWFSQLYEASVVVIDKESEVASHASRRNTGIVHRPYYLDPVKKKTSARSAEKSYNLWKKVATLDGLPWKELGTLMVATEEPQMKSLEKYVRWGVKNGMDEREYSLLGALQVKQEEPQVDCKGAIMCRSDAATDFLALTRSIWARTAENGTRFLPAARVEEVIESNKGASLRYDGGKTLECSVLINTAGGGSLGIAHKMGLAKGYADLQFRGEYWEVDPDRAPDVRTSVYSVARHEKFPFLDPHFVIRADGRKEVGPNAVLVSNPEAYRGVGGWWNLLRKAVEGPIWPKARLFGNGEFLSLVWGEWLTSLSKVEMCGRVKKFIPSMEPKLLVKRGLAGVRNSIVGKEGFVGEALTVAGQRSLHVLNYNSPGATGAPVFSADLVRQLQNQGLLDGLEPRLHKEAIWSFDETALE
jgi:L-2-hydroxyglutarate oxidase